MTKVMALEGLKERFGTGKAVHCHGVFDVLHIGHIRYLEAAKKMCPDHNLIVTITADEFVNKGPGRPRFNHETRAAMIASLEMVDAVAVSHYPTAVEAIEIIKPTVYVKGPDYADHSKDVTGKIKEEIYAVERNGGKVAYTNAPTESSSQIINEMFNPWSEAQKEIIERVQEAGGMDRIKKLIYRMEHLNIMVIGEPILDIYRFCEPQGVSSKSPSISAKFTREEKYFGGSWAIRNHLQGFSTNTWCMFPEEMQVPTKTRFITEDKSQRIFEITDVDNKPCASPHDFAQHMVGAANAMDLVLVADFGHGLFEGRVLDSVQDIRPVVALNVQTNSSNYGFNVFTKHKHFDYLCIDTRELRLAYNDRHKAPSYLAWRANQQYNRPISVTLGNMGSLLYDDNQAFVGPAFTSNIVDTIGAGDAYFALTSVLNFLEAPPIMTVFLGNVFAGLKTQIIGNKEAVSKAKLLKACASILS